MSDAKHDEAITVADSQKQLNRQVQKLSDPLSRASGWMKFVAVLSIIGPVVSVLMASWWSLIYLWLPVWTAVLLFQAAKHVSNASFSGSESELIGALDKLRLYFKITGVVALIGLIFGLITLLFAVPYWLRA